VHRFTRTETTADGVAVSVADDEYAQLSLAMRTGSDADAVFDALLARDQIRVHATDAECLAALAGDAVDAFSAGSPTVIVADTNEQVAVLNAAIRDRLVACDRVDDERTGTTIAGQRIGIGDRVTTRRNNANLDVANRDTWTVLGVESDGGVTVSGEYGERTLPAGYVREHVELAYASTAHGVQGDTTTTAHAVIGGHTSAASAYVGMTRGRETNVAHLVAESIHEAREQWVAVFARDRADLGPGRAAELAAAEAARYAPHRPFEQVMGELRRAWTVEEDCLDRLVRDEQRRDSLREIVPLRAARERELPPLEHAYRQAQQTERDARQDAKTARTTLTKDTNRIRESLLDAWDKQHAGIRVHAQTVRDGTGRFGQRHAAVTRAEAELTSWADAWRPDVPDLPTGVDRIADRVLWFEDRPTVWETLDHAARGQAEHENPDAVAALGAAETAADARQAASRNYRDTRDHYEQALARYGNLAHTEHPEQQLTRLQAELEATERAFTAARATVTDLFGEPTLRALPGDRITTERETWRADRETAATRRYARFAQLDADLSTDMVMHRHADEHDIAASPDHGPGISR
ncbi:MAG: TrwC relaxase, partial [Actinomycetota bacterium]|nr:TrwC relaxase [Actinomycetota bacterium]